VWRAFVLFGAGGQNGHQRHEIQTICGNLQIEIEKTVKSQRNYTAEGTYSKKKPLRISFGIESSDKPETLSSEKNEPAD
jgi:hypothetical protein